MAEIFHRCRIHLDLLIFHASHDWHGLGGSYKIVDIDRSSRGRFGITDDKPVMRWDEYGAGFLSLGLGLVPHKLEPDLLPFLFGCN